MSSFIFFKVLVKRTLSPLPPSMRTLSSLEPVVWTSLGPLPRWVLGPTTR
jgi:hypothetical protein